MREPLPTPPAADLERVYVAHLATMQARLEAALAATGFDGLVILAGDLQAPPRDDVTYPFRVEPHFAAWLPLNRVPGAALVLAPGKKPILLYPQEDDFWLVPARDPEGFWVERFDIRVIKTRASESPELKKLGAGCAVIGDAGAAEGAFRAHDDRRLLARLDYARAKKTEYEIACMRMASRIAARGHVRVGAAFGEHLSELALHSLYCDATEQREAELPYSSIVALNEHGAILHYQHLERGPPAETRSLLIDAGAEASGYAADVTRTWTGPGSAFAPLIASLEELQQTLCAEVRAGVDFVALNERAHELLAGVLAAHKLVTCSAQEAFASGLTRTFLPHGLGHLLGLQVHDAGGRQVTADGEIRNPPAAHPFLRLTRLLEPDFVLTIEPGIYFISSLLEKMPGELRRKLNWVAVEQFLAYGGIRIEDNVVVEKSGHRNLTREAFAACHAA
ncbi:MAG TPA: Xaa-Pro dipeptidase [Gammaproteobacteria bacterium]|jgi:Xaa-Pro dipeptidase